MASVLTVGGNTSLTPSAMMIKHGNDGINDGGGRDSVDSAITVKNSEFQWNVLTMVVAS